jgi:MFS family permease
VDSQPLETGAGATPGLYKPAYRNYVLALLFLGYAINAIDRGILGLLVEPIRHEFNATDTQLGFLGGIAFAIFYSIFGIPIAAWADRSSRKNILALAVFLWSAMTAACGMAVNFIMLVFTRIGTAVGEAGGTPPSHSLIADYFPLSKRATAISIYMTAIPVGTMMGSLLGGWGNEFFGWRVTFILAGIPGLILAPIIFLTVREPARGLSDHSAATTASDSAPLSVLDAFKFMWQHKSFRHLSLANALHALVIYAAATFNPAFLMRSHGMGSGDIGTLMAVLSGFGILGTFFGGYFADKLNVKHGDSRWYFWICGATVVITVPFQIIAYLTPNLWIVIPAFLVAVILSNVFFGPSYAMTQALASLRMRALAASVMLFIQTMIGYNLGPLFTGIISDHLAPMAGEDSLRYALAIIALFEIWSAIHYYFGSRYLRSDLITTQKFDGVGPR